MSIEGYNMPKTGTANNLRHLELSENQPEMTPMAEQQPEPQETETEEEMLESSEIETPESQSETHETNFPPAENAEDNSFETGPEAAAETPETETQPSAAEKTATIDTEMSKVSASISNTEAGLSQVRQELGMPPATEEPPSIADAKEKLDSLAGQKEQLNEATKEVENEAMRDPHADEAKEKEPTVQYLESDPRFGQIKEQLVNQWEKRNGSRYDRDGIQTAAFQDFMFGTTKDPFSLDDRTREEFGKTYTGDATEYAKREKTRVYESPSSDPVVHQFERSITETTNRNFGASSELREAREMNRASREGDIWQGYNAASNLHGWAEFARNYPEKAEAYGKMPGYGFLNEALEQVRETGTESAGFNDRIRNETRRLQDEWPLRTSVEQAESRAHERPVASREEVVQEIAENVSRNTLSPESAEEARRRLEGLPIEDLSTFYEIESSLDDEADFVWVDTDKIVGRPLITHSENPSWGYEYSNRQGRIDEIASEINAIAQANEGSSQEADHVFHTDNANERIKLMAIDGPAGPLYAVEDGTHRVAGSKLSRLDKIPGNVRKIKYPLRKSTSDIDTLELWKKLIDNRLIQGEIKESTRNGKQEYEIIIEKEALSWIRSSQDNLIKASKLYEKMYPGSLDNLPIPKEALLDPVANNFYMAGRWNEWIAMKRAKKTLR